MNSDLIIVGGSFAGLSAAMNIGRAGRNVLLLDAEEPRNRFSDESHGFFGFDGNAPSEILANARLQTTSYPNVVYNKTLVANVTQVEGGFTAICEDGAVHQGRRLLIATGVADTLPDVPGMRERWGGSVLHCPYCHGYEFLGKRTGIFAEGPIAIHQAEMVADWGPVTLFTNGVLNLDDESRARLAARKVTIETSSVTGLQGHGLDLQAVTLADGRNIPISVLYIATQVRLRNNWAETLGCTIDRGPLGPVIKTDERQATNVEGVFAAGDCARQPQSATFACADGVASGMAIHASLVEEDIRQCAAVL